MIDAKKLAREEFTVCRDPAKEESIVSMSLHYNINRWYSECSRITHLSKTVQHTACTTDSQQPDSEKEGKHRPWGVVSWNRNVARTTVTKSCLFIPSSA
jgi:hypothetical protein